VGSARCGHAPVIGAAAVGAREEVGDSIAATLRTIFGSYRANAHAANA
jgi:hypothetical protein